VIDGWKLNYNYWTSGTQKNSPGNWTWCGLGQRRLNSDMIFETKVPDKNGTEDCISMRIGRNGSGIQLIAKNCTLRFIYACQVSISFLLYTNSE
jgi:hypothetical protein